MKKSKQPIASKYGRIASNTGVVLPALIASFYLHAFSNEYDLDLFLPVFDKPTHSQKYADACDPIPPKIPNRFIKKIISTSSRQNWYSPTPPQKKTININLKKQPTN